MKRRTELEKIGRVLRHFQTLDIEMQIPTILTFLELAMWDDTKAPSVTELGKKIGTKTTTTAGSRNIMAWSDTNRSRKKGYDMMEAKENPEYRVEKLVYMKPSGYAFADSLIELLKKENKNGNT